MFRFTRHIGTIPVVVHYLWHLLVVWLHTNTNLRSALEEQRLASGAPTARANVRDVYRLRRMVCYCAAVRLGTCLLRSLAAWRFLRGSGISAKVIIAPASSSGEPFSAHAWVEVAGGGVIGDALRDVEVFTSNGVTGSRQVKCS